MLRKLDHYSVTKIGLAIRDYNNISHRSVIGPGPYVITASGLLNYADMRHT